MYDFLMFRSFVTPSFLLIFYYVGAVLMPFLAWLTWLWLKRKYFPETVLPKQIYIYTFFLLGFLMMELFWRMMFEIMIAYFDMHDALMKISS